LTINPLEASITEANPEVVTLVRLAKGWSKKRLADSANVSSAHVSRVELGKLRLVGRPLLDYARALDCRPALLCVDYQPSPPEGTHYRKHATVAEWKRLRAWAGANLAALRVGRILALADYEPALSLPSLPPEDYEAEEAEITVAQVLRRMWRLHGRISDMTALLEAAGIFVIYSDFGDSVVDAATIRGRDGCPPIIIVNRDLPADRLRMTLGHELGHLVMDTDESLASPDEIERRATSFAAEFLAPYEEIAAALERVTPRTLHELDELRMVWGVSQSSLVKRAYQRELFTEHRYRSMFRLLNDSGRLYGERGGVDREKASLIDRFVSGLSGAGYEPAEIDTITLANDQQRADAFGIVPRADPTPRRHLAII
jgi:Zn-dependent peptidase ImmA (M78 family)/transcriptional regulator with XRE-family HTH domain